VQTILILKEYILYQAYGMVDVINECKYSLLRLIDVYESAQLTIPEVIIYTDKSEEFAIFSKQITLTLKSINDNEINKWRGEINFVHRVKIEVIKDCFKYFSGKITYCDTDTYILQPLTKMFQCIDDKNVFFHTNEGEINASVTVHARKWKNFLQKNKVLFNEQLPLNVIMWNAGVIGIPEDAAVFLDSVLALTDEIYRLFPRHTVEQFSFAYIFQKNKINILAAEPYIFHYWDLKEFRKLLRRFFADDSNIDDLIKKSKKILPENILVEKMKFKKSNALKKLVLSVSGKRWKIEKYKI
jgi:hypothetical protein